MLSLQASMAVSLSEKASAGRSGRTVTFTAAGAFSLRPPVGLSLLGYATSPERK
jgi:hypothetical protein